MTGMGNGNQTGDSQVSCNRRRQPRDVGYMNQARFNRLFNILLPADDPSQEIVPDHHNPFKAKVSKHIISGILFQTSFVRPESHWSSTMDWGNLPQGCRGSQFRPLDSGEIMFSCKEKPGAVSCLPMQAKREDTVLVKTLARLEIDQMENIVLLTGIDLTRSSTNVAFLGSQANEWVSFGVDIAGSKINWQCSPERKSGAAAWNWGPRGENLPEDQCIFIRGFRVNKRTIWWQQFRA
ncbi:hypothetical protein EI94DRAFT_1790264, partial [Lactarius quietus]